MTEEFELIGKWRRGEQVLEENQKVRRGSFSKEQKECVCVGQASGEENK